MIAKCIHYGRILLSLGYVTSLAVDSSSLAESRWPSDREQFQPAPPFIAEMLINNFAGRDDLKIIEVWRYRPDRSMDDLKIAEVGLYGPDR